MRADRPLRLAVTMAAALALTACGDTHRIVPSDKATPVAVGSVPATVNPAPTKAAPSPTAGETGAPSASPTGDTGGGGGGGTEVKATATNKFEPAVLKVKKGAKVTWTAEGFHTVTSGTPAGPDPKGPMKSDAGFKTYSVTFTKAGTYKYYCQPHATLKMEGEIVVG